MVGLLEGKTFGWLDDWKVGWLDLGLFYSLLVNVWSESELMGGLLVGWLVNRFSGWVVGEYDGWVAGLLVAYLVD